ncbi:MAG: DNA translocase FtsK [Bacillota bacterium]|nr:DNA translocase FtsK [Bacillota bacterium]
MAAKMKKKSNMRNSQNRKSSRTTVSKNNHVQAKALVLFACALLLLFLTFIKGQNVWCFLHSFLLGLSGLCAFLWPLFMIFVAFTWAKEKQNARIKAKLWLSISFIVSASAVVYLCFLNSTPSDSYLSGLSYAYSNGTALRGAGLLGAFLGYPMAVWFGLVGARITFIILSAVLFMFLTGITLSHIADAAKKPVAAAKRYNEQRHLRADEYEEYDDYIEYDDEYVCDDDDNEEKSAEKQHDRIDIPLFGKNKRKHYDESIDIPLEEGKKPIVPKSKNTDKAEYLKEITSIFNNAPGSESLMASEIAQNISESKKSPVTVPDAKQPDPQTVPVDYNELIKGIDTYKYPPISLLNLSKSANDVGAMNELQDNAAKLITTLESFGVSAKIINICRGPSVTRYELQPAAGVKISRITNLSDDIALNLAADGVRIEAPIPGKAAVGIEVPNKIVSMVSMRELIDSKEFKKEKSKLAVVLGRDISGNIVITDLSKMPHLLIAGTTGSGKSVCVNSILISILYKASPDEVKLLLVDPKMVEFSKYKGIPHLLIPVVSDAKKAAGALNWAVGEMLNRYKLFSEYNVKDIHSYNSMVEDNIRELAEKPPLFEEEQQPMTADGLPIPTEKMPQIVIAIDELADLMMVAPNEVEESICRLAQMARAAGMHLVIATQRPSVNVITGVIKANIPSRVALKVSSQVDSRTIIDFGGAEKLIGRGDMLFLPVGASKTLRVQGCYASDEEIEGVTAFLKKNANFKYDENVIEQIDRIAAEDLNKKGKNGGLGGEESESSDPMMEDAIKCVVEAGQASTSLLQRRLKLGYARAGRLIDEMEQMGIVGPHEGSKPRSVLITHQEWLERRNNLG